MEMYSFRPFIWNEEEETSAARNGSTDYNTIWIDSLARWVIVPQRPHDL